jgi:hypothetical protein
MDRTVLRPIQPIYSINEVVYSRASSLKGYVEPLKIYNMEFDPSRNQYRYYFFRSIDVVDGILPITLLESEVLNVCDALDNQIGVLSREYNDMSAKLDAHCGGELVEAADIVQPTYNKELVSPPRPRFGYNSMIYLRETAEVTGVLESYRVDDIKWDRDNLQWVYYSIIRPRPEKNSTVGDRGDLTHDTVLSFIEVRLCTVCEAISLAVSFLSRALSRAQSRRQSYCS